MFQKSQTSEVVNKYNFRRATTEDIPKVQQMIQVDKLFQLIKVFI